jgi:hypothetical protein
MAKDHEHEEHGSRLERLVEGVQDALLATERANVARHIELMAALGKSDNILGKLNALRSRLCKIAKALKALDDAT